jgi:6-phosphogluconolactonase
MKLLISLIFLVCFNNLAHCQTKNNRTYNLLIGTYTDGKNSDGIYIYNFNSQTGDFHFKSKVAGIENPSYLAISSDGKKVYSVNEVKEGGGVSSFDFNSTSGELTFLNHVSSGGNGPAYIAVDNQNKFVFAANYNTGSVSAIPLNNDGTFTANVQTIQDQGSSVHARQKGPHVHCTILSPDNKFLLSTDLGTDKVSIFHFDPLNLTQPLTPVEPAFISIKPGSGPRHITFHPNSRFAYLINEMGGTVIVYDYNKGNLTEKQIVNISSADFTGKVSAADIHISPDGRFLYGSNRGDANEIVIYSIKKDGQLNFVARQSTLGKAPRNFVIDPSGKFLLVANQDSNEIIFFRRDQKTGLLTDTGKKIQVSKPVCLKFDYQ